MKKVFVFLFVFVIAFIFVFSIFSYKNKEGFTLEQASGEINSGILVKDIYPPTNSNKLSNYDSSNMWWHYPTFHLGSYEQITNNIKYPNNPDIGRCMPGSMCGALYHSKNIGSNVINPLPPVGQNCGTRVGYFNANERLITSLPFTSDLPNILY
jgi:hypothetical protein